MTNPKLTDDDLIVLWEGLWVEDDRRLDLVSDANDLAKAVQTTHRARALLQPVMDARGLRSEMEDHIIGVDRLRLPSGPDAPRPTSHP